MVISEKNKFIFIHNPKCAGTSIRSRLNPYDSLKKKYWMGGYFDGQYIDLAHMPLYMLKKYSPEHFSLLSSFFVFGFVRNPFSRVISAFNEKYKKIYSDLISDTLNFEEYKFLVNQYILTIPTDTEFGGNNFIHCVKQSDMFCLNGKNYADLTIKVESMDTGMKKLEALRPDIYVKIKDLGKRNVKKLSSSNIELLTASSISHIKDVYRNDFILFDYDIDEI